MFRYRVSDLPPNGVGAFMPIPAGDRVALGWGSVNVVGSPGTDPSPAPAPQASYLPALTALGGVDSAQPSRATGVPDQMLFSVYYTDAFAQGPAADAGIGMTRRRFNELPMPAVDPARIPIVSMQPAPRLGGRIQIGWPRVFQRFPSVSSGGPGG